MIKRLLVTVCLSVAPSAGLALSVDDFSASANLSLVATKPSFFDAGEVIQTSPSGAIGDRRLLAQVNEATTDTLAGTLTTSIGGGVWTTVTNVEAFNPVSQLIYQVALQDLSSFNSVKLSYQSVAAGTFLQFGVNKGGNQFFETITALATPGTAKEIVFSVDNLVGDSGAFGASSLDGVFSLIFRTGLAGQGAIAVTVESIELANVAAVPVPATLPLLLGACGFVAAMRRRQQLRA